MATFQVISSNTTFLYLIKQKIVNIQDKMWYTGQCYMVCYLNHTNNNNMYTLAFYTCLSTELLNTDEKPIENCHIFSFFDQTATIV